MLLEARKPFSTSIGPRPQIAISVLWQWIVAVVTLQLRHKHLLLAFFHLCQLRVMQQGLTLDLFWCWFTVSWTIITVCLPTNAELAQLPAAYHLQAVSHDICMTYNWYKFLHGLAPTHLSRYCVLLTSVPGRCQLHLLTPTNCLLLEHLQCSSRRTEPIILQRQRLLRY